jgi:hypothetical protein
MLSKSSASNIPKYRYNLIRIVTTTLVDDHDHFLIFGDFVGGISMAD